MVSHASRTNGNKSGWWQSDYIHSFAGIKDETPKIAITKVIKLIPFTQQLMWLYLFPTTLATKIRSVIFIIITSISGVTCGVYKRREI